MTRAIQRPDVVYMTREQTRKHRSRTNQARACIAVAATLGSLPTIIFVADGFVMTTLLWGFLGTVAILLGLALFYLQSAGRVAARALNDTEQD